MIGFWCNKDKELKLNLFIFSDWHILEKEIEECSLVGDELTGLIKKYNVNHVISAGDIFDQVYPTYNEINLFANFIKTINLKTFKES